MDPAKARSLVERLVTLSSLSGYEQKICDFVSSYIEALGFAVETQEVYKTGYNVVTRLGRGDKVLFCGHLDVVPEFDMVDAFNPRVVDDRVYGRGACDMKGGVASLLLLLESVREMKTEPDVTFAFVVDEEMYGRGAAELILHGTRAEVCVITEPTNNVVCPGTASCMEFRLTALGTSGHGASRSERNAIKTLMRFLDVFEQRLTKELTVLDDEYPMEPIINIGRFEGGFGPWVIPPKASCEVLVHMHPKITYRTGTEVLENVFSGIVKEHGVMMELTMLHGCDGYLIPRQNPYLKLLQLAYIDETGQHPRMGYMESENDGNAIFHKGGIPCIVYGPGDIAYAHSSQEHVSIKDVIECYRVLRRFINMVSGLRK